MTHNDQQILFTSLGFLTVLLHGNTHQEEDAKRAKSLAWLIEQFCHTAIPEAFGETKDYSADQISDERVDALLETFKENLLKNEVAILPEDRSTLARIYEHLQERASKKHSESLSNEDLGDAILELVDAEISEGKMPNDCD